MDRLCSPRIRDTLGLTERLPVNIWFISRSVSAVLCFSDLSNRTAGKLPEKSFLKDLHVNIANASGGVVGINSITLSGIGKPALAWQLEFVAICTNCSGGRLLLNCR